MSDLDKISSVFNAKIDSVNTKDDLQNIKTEFFGKNGQITQQFKTLGSLDSGSRCISRPSLPSSRWNSDLSLGLSVRSVLSGA